MKQDLILALGGKWISRTAGHWQVADKAPALSAPARVLADFGGTISGVAAVDVKPEFAGPVIEKRLRTEGLLDGEARVLIHRTIATGGGSRVFYSAIPLSAWQAGFTWLDGESRMGLLYMPERAMLRSANEYDIVVFAAGRSLRALVSNVDELEYAAVTAYSEDSDDMQTAVRNLSEQLKKTWSARPAQCKLLWCDLLASRDADTLAQDLAQELQAQLARAPEESFVADGQAYRTGVATIVESLAVSAALNPPWERFAFFAEQAKAPMAAAIGFAGALLLAGAGYFTIDAVQSRARAAQLNAEAAQVAEQSAGMDMPVDRLLAKHAATLQLLQGVSDAVRSPDALRVLNTLRSAAHERVRIMRVRLAPDGAYRIDGVPASGTSPQALAGFVAAMRVAGYKVDAEDPGNHGQQPGFFSYLVRPVANSGAAEGRAS